MLPIFCLFFPQCFFLNLENIQFNISIENAWLPFSQLQLFIVKISFFSPQLYSKKKEKKRKDSQVFWYVTTKIYNSFPNFIFAILWQPYTLKIYPFFSPLSTAASFSSTKLSSWKHKHTPLHLDTRESRLERSIAPEARHFVLRMS